MERKKRIGSISGVVFSPDSQHLYVGTQTTWLSRSGAGPVEGFDDQVSIWTVETGKRIDQFSGGDFYKLDAIRLSPDGRKMLLTYWDAILLWDIDKRQTAEDMDGFRLQLERCHVSKRQNLCCRLLVLHKSLGCCLAKTPIPRIRRRQTF